MKTIINLFAEAKKRPAHLTAVKFKKGTQWKEIPWKELYQEVERTAAGLLSLGVSAGDSIAVLSETRYEWQICDLAILGIGCVTVPIYQSQRPEEIEYIINDSETKVLICEDTDQLAKWKNIAAKCPSVKDVIVIDGYKGKSEGLYSWKDFLINGKNWLKNNEFNFEDSCKKSQLEDIATIIYTSGTTGSPKGVVLTHLQVASEVNELFDLLQLTEKDCTLTFLPFAHILGRIEMWGSIVKGYTLAYAESTERIKHNLVEVKPTLLIAVPRIFEKLYNGIYSQVETNKYQNKFFNFAVDIGKRVSQNQVNKESSSFADLVQLQVFKKLIFAKIKDRLGGRLRFAFSGGAPLSSTVAEFFHSIGILVIEGYGLSETTAAITVNTPLDYRFGTVGKPFGDVEIKLASDGEILVKSAKVMKEYYKNPQATATAFSDGFFATGDIGEFTDDGFLRITDRKKDLIKTAGGKYVAPQRLENLLKLNPFISNVLIHGDQRKYIVALVTLAEDEVRKFALKNGISYSDLGDLSDNDLVRAKVREAIAEVNDALASYESIKNFEILPKDFTIDAGELTPSLKVKRKFCDEKYKNQLDKLYGIDNSGM